MGTDLTSFFRENNFKTDGNLSYGIYNGHILSVRKAGGYLKVSFSFNKPIEKDKAQTLSMNMKKVKDNHKILQQAMVSSISLEILLYQANDLDEEFRPVVTEVCQILDENFTFGLETCPLCGNVLTTDAPFLRIKDCVIQAHENCICQLESTTNNINNAIENKEKKVSMTKPIVIGILCLLLSIVIFFLLGLINCYPYFVGLSGWACFYLIKFVYKQFKVLNIKKNAIALSIFSFLALVLSIFTGAVSYFYINLISNMTFTEILKDFWNIFASNPELTKSIIYSAIWGVLLLAIPVTFSFLQLRKIKANSIKRLDK